MVPLDKYQLEYSRNLVFTIGGRMDQVFQALIDRTRSRMDLRTVKTILGHKHQAPIRSTGRRCPLHIIAVPGPTIADVPTLGGGVARTDRKEEDA